MKCLMFIISLSCVVCLVMSACESQREKIELLIKQLEDAEDNGLRRQAALALVAIGEPAVPALIEALRRDGAGPLTHGSVAWALGEIGEPAKTAIPALIEALRDEPSFILASGHLSDCAAEALCKIGKPAVPALIEKLETVAGAGGLFEAVLKKPFSDLLLDRDAVVRTRIVRALATIGEPAVPALIGALAHGDKYVRADAASALDRIGRPARYAIPALVMALRDEDVWVRYQAAGALGSIGLYDQAAIAALIQALKDNDSGVRLRAAWSLGRIGERHRDVVRALIEALNDKQNDGLVRDMVIRSLAGVGGSIEVLMEALKDVPLGTRVGYEIAGALRKMGTSEALKAAEEWEKASQEREKASQEAMRALRILRSPTKPSNIRIEPGNIRIEPVQPDENAP